jgi:hypothetical protein
MFSKYLRKIRSQNLKVRGGDAHIRWRVLVPGLDLAAARYQAVRNAGPHGVERFDCRGVFGSWLVAIVAISTFLRGIPLAGSPLFCH